MCASNCAGRENSTRIPGSDLTRSPMKEIRVKVHTWLPAGTMIVSPDVFSAFKEAIEKENWAKNFGYKIEGDYDEHSSKF
jgi:hypothetical protein